MNAPAEPLETVLQFGTGKFLRCFADLFLHEMARAGRDCGRAVVVQSMGAERVQAFHRQGGRYRVAIRGLDHGQSIDRTVEVESVSRALAAASDWDRVLDVARSPALKAIVTNATEAGYALAEDEVSGPAAARSFPAKLLQALRARHESGGQGLTILPCELLDDNADKLLALVIEQARRWRLHDALIDWVGSQCRWRNTLVDRIVSAPSPGDPLAESDPLFAVAEPFALWLIEGTEPAPVFDHPPVRHVDDLQPYRLRKVRILNGAHTAMVAKAMPLGFETVREAVADASIEPWLHSLLFEEIVPTLEGRTREAEQFARDTLERFANPFLDHRLADIALHHDVKLGTRLAPTAAEYRERFHQAPRLLDAILGPA